MYICPVCQRKFEKEDWMRKHYLACWKEHNPNHISKPAPRSETLESREVCDDVTEFFAKGVLPWKK